MTKKHWTEAGKERFNLHKKKLDLIEPEEFNLSDKEIGEDNVCENCGEIRSNHIDYFNTNKKDVCPYRKSMKFSRKKNGN